MTTEHPMAKRMAAQETLGEQLLAETDEKIYDEKMRRLGKRLSEHGLNMKDTGIVFDRILESGKDLTKKNARDAAEMHLRSLLLEAEESRLLLYVAKRLCRFGVTYHIWLDGYDALQLDKEDDYKIIVFTANEVMAIAYRLAVETTP